ncbi:MAG: hypothetical protein H6600_09725 [Flavobacteriales bacterium]|nr:hypothetical protein [Flavobacteriales bacterium]MCB9198729.1 hypothetical protein [Flavobacteriales bacterium]
MSIARFFESGEVTQDKGHVKNLVLLAKADGQVSDAELLLIHKIGRHVGLTYGQIGEIIDNPNKYEVIPPVSKIERLEHMVDMVDLIHVDGVIDNQEMNLVTKFAIQIGFTSAQDAHVAEILDLLNEGKSREEIVSALA